MTKVTGFYRDGQKAGQFEVESFEKGVTRREEMHTVTCNRCGGLGGSDAWKHTGWTCYKCNGARFVNEYVNAKIYTAEQLEKVNKAAEKRAATMARKAEAKRLAEEKRLEDERAGFEAMHGEWLEKVSAYAHRSGFVADVVKGAKERLVLTENQIAAVNKTVAKMEASDNQKEASEFVGSEGDRVELEARVTYFRSMGRYTYNAPMTYMVKMVTVDGNSLTYFGTAAATFGIKADSEGFMVVDKEAVVRFKATVKKCETYEGEKQTVITRPKGV